MTTQMRHTAASGGHDGCTWALYSSDVAAYGRFMTRKHRETTRPDVFNVE